MKGPARNRTGVSGFADRRLSARPRGQRETALAVTRLKGTEQEAEIVLIERSGHCVFINLDDGETLVFDAEEFDRA